MKRYMCPARDDVCVNGCGQGVLSDQCALDDAAQPEEVHQEGGLLPSGMSIVRDFRGEGLARTVSPAEVQSWVEQVGQNRNTGGSPLPWQEKAADQATMTSTGREGCLACTHLDGGVFCEGRPRGMCLVQIEKDGGVAAFSSSTGGDALSAEATGGVDSPNRGERVTHSPTRATCRVCGRGQRVEGGALVDHFEAGSRFDVCAGSGEEV